MPGQTPIYGFMYPCPDETISPMVFQTLANQIDAKLLELQGDYTLMLNRPNFDSANSTAQTVPAGVDTVLTSPVVTYVVPMAGMWVFAAHAFAINITGTVAVHRLSLRQNGVFRFAQTQNTEASNFNPCDIAGPIIAAAGDTITLRWLFGGTGNEDVIASLNAKLVVRSA